MAVVGVGRRNGKEEEMIIKKLNGKVEKRVEQTKDIFSCF